MNYFGFVKYTFIYIYTLYITLSIFQRHYMSKYCSFVMQESLINGCLQCKRAKAFKWYILSVWKLTLEELTIKGMSGFTHSLM